MRRQCRSCPSTVLMGRDCCHPCRQLREREQAAAQRRKAGTAPRAHDFSRAQIRDRYIRALWRTNPRLARLLWARRAA